MKHLDRRKWKTHYDEGFPVDGRWPEWAVKWLGILEEDGYMNSFWVERGIKIYKDIP